MRRWFRRVLFWLRSGKMAEELRQEIETHRSLRQDALERAGADDPAAASRRALGNIMLAREDAREMWIWRWLDDMARDVRYAIRGLWRQPGFAMTSILSIAIGTGTLASVLSVVHAVVLRPAPYPNADRIVQIGQLVNGRNRSEVSMVDVLALREASRSLSHVTIAWFSNASLAGGGLPERARRVYTDSQAFDMLGVQPLIGRLPTAADDALDAESVVVIGHGLWSERFGSDREVIGRTLRVDGQQHTVIGVMPAGFRFPAPYWASGDLWLLRGPSHPSWPDSRARMVLAFGLLKEGATIERAQLEAEAVATALDARYPDANGRIGLQLTTWAETVRTAARPRLWLLLGAAGIVFLIVCVNVANLLVSRGLDRQREMAARVALGAGSARLVRQLLTETVVLFLFGGSAGVLAAIWGSRLLVAIRSGEIPGMDEATLDARVAIAAMAITLAAAAIVGLVPALQAATARMSDLAAPGGRGTSRVRGWHRIQCGLVAAEIGLALVLLCGAAVLLEGARKLARVDPGFDPSGLLHARVALPPEKYPALEAQVAFYERVIDGLLKIPGVTAAGAVNLPPGVGGSGHLSVVIDADPVPASDGDLRRADVRVVSAGYLEALGLTPRAGHFFSALDSPTVPIAIVNEAFARQYFDGPSAVGRRLRITFGSIDALDPLPRTVVGVVANLKEKTLYEPTPPTVYVPITQAGSWRVALRMALLVRSPRPPGDLIPLIRAAIAQVDAEQAASGFMAMGDLMESELSLNRLNLALLSVLSTVALFLAVIGVYGVTAQAVRQRTREIGIRLALGVPRGGVISLLLREAGTLVLFGVGCGAVAAIWSTGLLRSLVHGIDHTSTGTFVSAGVVLAVAVLGGCYFPARRAARIDPAIVLRSE
jgi:putative ABC transport system permease protein